MSAVDIEGYAAGLAAALRGPRRVRDDLVAEARDSLIDAAEAYEDAGLSPADAQRRAVAEFGSYQEIVPDYQAELAVAQGRRTAMLIALALPTLYLLAPLMWRHGPWPGGHPMSAGYLRLASSFDYLSLAGGLLAAVVLLGFGWGSRYVRDGVRLTHAVGYGALTFLLVHGIAGGVVYLWSVAQWPAAVRWPLLGAGAAMWVAFDYAAVCAWRCLATSRAQRAAQRRISRRPVGA
ncbi:permease prefix domain 1-containing protein [Rugosimonospora acidiphila]|uniref:permease prefix domain 1-containing protein n=1 Tax=Rugosimonospora acidiphila TaxID=556531 RepID=UPI0031E855D8